ncbi:hypothetical protein ER308_11600 [Egibacter rhizosphaerae]|uniref:Transposase DDE domain-containing protein n=1 Tax=Egibacter rhizosphaerae TaxID=1670831 RepID=A0A411YFZ0_9ACTN|nr:hypothetical protein [Egibacter rhizosphaerae]QBI20143.1 hypothetical protein ER308_11600 [Egibacter rhizosphaerae]
MSAKLDQPFYWGSRKWRASYDRRTYVEGFFGNVQNASAENLRRGFVRTTGLGPIRLMLAITAAACNVRQLRNWHADTGLGDPEHPLLAPDEANHGFVELTADQAETLDRAYLDAA